jgi:hypothetical protein
MTTGPQDIEASQRGVRMHGRDHGAPPPHFGDRTRESLFRKNSRCVGVTGCRIHYYTELAERVGEFREPLEAFRVESRGGFLRQIELQRVERVFDVGPRNIAGDEDKL